jgi:DNA-binding MarR family transcriptional regulator
VPEDPRWLSPEERAAWLATSALMMRLPGALDSRLLRESGLSFYEYMVLAMLSEHPDRSLRMSQLAGLTSGSLSRLSHVARRLEEQGLLTRTRLPGPGRPTLATLTDAGWARVVGAAPGHVRDVRELLVDALSAEDLAALERVGRAVNERLDADPVGPPALGTDESLAPCDEPERSPSP